MNMNSIIIPPRWSSKSDGNMANDLFFIQDNTHSNEGWWVLMKEECGAMILFTDLRKEIAEDFKARLDMAIAQYLEI
jgi:hypothetical protein